MPKRINHKLKDKEWLYHHYVTLNLPTIDIAKLAGCNDSGQVHYWSKKHGLTRQPHNTTWTQDTLVHFVINHYEELRKLSFKEIKDNYYDFFRACYSRFGSLKKAFDLAGLKYINEKFDDENLLLLLKEHFTDTRTLLKPFPYLKQISYRFGNLDNALALIGLPKREELRRQERQRLIIIEIINLSKTEDKLNSSYIKRNYSRLYNRAYEAFGTWTNAINAAGLEHKLSK